MDKIKIKYSKVIPFQGFMAMQLFGTIFVREEYKDRKLSDRTILHETIHLLHAQDFIKNNKDSKFIFYLNFCIFYIWYLIEWLFKCIISAFTLGKVRAYKSISTEIIAYENEINSDYPKSRNRFDWCKKIFAVVKK